MDAPSNKLKKNGKKYDNMEEVLKDTHDLCANIFEKRVRPDGVSIENFLGDLRQKPEVLSKILTDEKKAETNKKITETELKEALDRVSSKNPRNRWN